jgi:serine/threonine protein kinase
MSIKLIHDVDYLHLDIKPENFLFSRVRNNIEIKIIDFGMIKKCNFTTFNPFGSIEYLPNDWIKNFSENPPRETILQKHHDIFSLGCTFIKIIYFILNYIIFTYFKRNIKIPELCCPTVFREISDKKKCKKRGEYSFNGNPDHPQNPMKEINEIFKKIITTRSNNIFREIKQLSDIICKMCNSIPTERYQSIDEIIVDFKFTKSLRRNNNKWE